MNDGFFRRQRKRRVLLFCIQNYSRTHKTNATKIRRWHLLLKQRKGVYASREAENSDLIDGSRRLLFLHQRKETVGRCSAGLPAPLVFRTAAAPTSTLLTSSISKHSYYNA